MIIIPRLQLVSTSVTTQPAESSKNQKVESAILQVRLCLARCNFWLGENDIERAGQSILQAYDELEKAEQIAREIWPFEVPITYQEAFAGWRDELDNAARKLINSKSASQPASQYSE